MGICTSFNSIRDIASTRKEKFLNKFQNDEDLLKGDFDNLKKTTNSKCIRIFLSSTFSDFKIERDHIFANIYPNLRKTCLEKYQLDLIFIDMRWGITDNSVKNNLANELCIDEIENCHRESFGPSFIALIGQRYGSKTLKPILESHEYDLFNIQIELHGTKKIAYKNTKNLLKLCYALDKNQINRKIYKLRAITDILADLYPNDSLDEQQAINEWSQLQSRLFQTIDFAISKIPVVNETIENLRASITRQEIQEGILNNKNRDKECIAFIRHINDIENLVRKKKSENTQIEKYLELSQLDNILNLINDTKNILFDENIHELYVDWSKTNCLDPKTEALKTYLKNFQEKFNNSVICLIEKNLKSKPKDSDVSNQKAEIFHHAHFCNGLYGNFLPRPYLTEIILSYIADQDNTKPFIIYGNSGSGKSSITAFIAKNVKKSVEAWRQSTVIVRFMGTSRLSSSIKNVFLSVLNQLKAVYKLDFPDASTHNSVMLKDLLLKQLYEISEIHTNEKILLLLDSIDQLTQQDYDLDWFIFENLPKNIKLIYSTLANYNGIIQRIDTKLPLSDTNYLEVKTMELTEGIGIVDTLLGKVDRKLQKNQRSIVEKCILHASDIYPLHLRLLVDVIAQWTSFEHIDTKFSHCVSTIEAIKYVFHNLEPVYGKIFFSHCIFYLTIFQNGITENELEDVLSIDDDVLTSIFEYHEPPIRRFPFSIWIRLKQNLKQYLTEKESDDLTVISWFHRAFIDASKETYAELFEKSDTRDRLLLNIIDYFTEKWNKEAKPFESSDKMKLKLQQFTKQYARRNTKSQEMEYKSQKTNKVCYNKRKLNELIYFINQLSNDQTKISLLHEHVYLNYDFIYTKAISQSMDFVVDLHSDVCDLYSKYKNTESIAEKIEDLFELSHLYKENLAIIHKYPQALSYLLTNQFKVRSLQAKQFIKASIKHCGLFLNKNDFSSAEKKFQNVFLTNSNEKARKIYWCSRDDTQVFFIETVTENMSSNFYAVNYENFRLLGTLELKIAAQSTRLLSPQGVYDKEMSKFNDDNITLICSNGNQLHFYKFDNPNNHMIDEAEDITSLILLNQTDLLVRFEQSFKIINFKNLACIQIIEKYEFEYDAFVKFSISNMPIQIVHQPEIDSITTTYIIFGLSNREIKVFKYENSSKHLEFLYDIDILTNLNDYNQERISKYIDTAYLKHNLLLKPKSNQDLVMRFAIVDDESFKVKIIQLYKNAQPIVLQILKEDFEMYNINSGGIKILGFLNNKIVLYRHLYLMVYDCTEKMQLLLKTKISDQLALLENENTIVVNSWRCFGIYKYDTRDNSLKQQAEIKQISSVQLNLNKFDFKLKDMELICRRESSSVIKWNYEKHSDTNIKESAGFEVVKIEFTLGDNHIFTKMKGKQIGIIDLVDHCIDQSIEYEELIGCSEEFVVILNEEYQMEVYNLLTIKEEPKYVKVPNTPNQQYKHQLMQTFFNKDNFIIVFYNRIKNQLEVLVYRIGAGFNTFEISLHEIFSNLNGIKISQTEKQQHLVFYEPTKTLILFIDLQNGQIAKRIDIKNEYLIQNHLFEIELCDLSWLLIVQKRTILYCRCVTEVTFEKIKTDDGKIKIQKFPNFLLIITQNNLQIFNLKRVDFKNPFLIQKANISHVIDFTGESCVLYTETENLSTVYHIRLTDATQHFSMTLTKMSITKAKLSSNRKYLFLLYNQREISFIRLSDMYELSCLYLNENYANWNDLIVNNKFVTFLLSPSCSLLSLLYIDKNDAEHLKRINKLKFLE